MISHNATPIQSQTNYQKALFGDWNETAAANRELHDIIDRELEHWIETRRAAGCSRLSPRASRSTILMVLQFVRSMRSNHGRPCNAGNAWIAAQLCLTARTVKFCFSILKSAGIVGRIERFRHGRQRSNVTTIRPTIAAVRAAACRVFTRTKNPGNVFQTPGARGGPARPTDKSTDEKPREEVRKTLSKRSLGLVARLEAARSSHISSNRLMKDQQIDAMRTRGRLAARL